MGAVVFEKCSPWIEIGLLVSPVVSLGKNVFEALLYFYGGRALCAQFIGVILSWLVLLENQKVSRYTFCTITVDITYALISTR